MTLAQAVREAFPEIDCIDDDALRDGVLEAWTTAVAEVGIHDLATVPWLPPDQAELGIEDESLVDHVRDVTRGALALADILGERPEPGVDRDLLVAGALVHDVSKLYEFDGHEPTDIYHYLGHPHYGVHVAARAGLPPAVQHVVLCHSHRTGVEPATLEAEIVRCVDEAAASAIRLRGVDDLRRA